jgi:hypothetical protein
LAALYILKYPVRKVHLLSGQKFRQEIQGYLSFFKENKRISKFSQYTEDNGHSLDKINDTWLIFLFSNKGLLRKRPKSFIVKKKMS